jgi:hypothetical protein
MPLEREALDQGGRKFSLARAETSSRQALRKRRRTLACPSIHHTANATSAPGNIWMSSRDCGIAGRTTLSSTVPRRPFIASTQAEADRLQDEINELIQPEYSLTQLRQMIGLDLSGFDLDGPFPRHLIDTENAHGVSSRFKPVVDIADREKPTIR